MLFCDVVVNKENSRIVTNFLNDDENFFLGNSLLMQVFDLVWWLNNDEWPLTCTKF